MLFDDEELLIDDPLIELDAFDAGPLMEWAGLCGFLAGLADMALLPVMELLPDIVLPLDIALLPDMVFPLLPAVVLCAKAGAVASAATRAAAAAMEIVFMVFPFDGRRGRAG